VRWLSLRRAVHAGWWRTVALKQLCHRVLRFHWVPFFHQITVFIHISFLLVKAAAACSWPLTPSALETQHTATARELRTRIWLFRLQDLDFRFQKIISFALIISPRSSVGTMMRLQAGQQENRTSVLSMSEVFVFSKRSRKSLWHNHLSTQRVPTARSLWINGSGTGVDHPLQSSDVLRTRGSKPPLFHTSSLHTT
jgi:hypothetical protein